MIIIPGPASRGLGERIAAKLGVDAHPVEHRVFPDGESYIRLTAPVEGEAAVIVQTTSPPQDARLMQLFMMAATAADLGAESVVCVVPYLAYARQDKRFLDGEALSLDVVLKLLEDAGADVLIVIDAHNADSLRRVQRRHGIRVENLSAIPLLAEHLRERSYGGAYSLAPDEGAVHLAEMGGKVLGGTSDFFVKRRDRRTGEIEMVVKDLDIRGRDAVVFDDIISSGGTMARAVEGLKRQGAERVAAACTHGLFMGDAEKRIREAGADLIVATDTVESKFSAVSVARIIAERLKEVTP
ncbi:ribose-phosphate pyrophosphokinase [Candidatus Bathyarchaeota archaeon]|nr:MAG: ribose-phosphate pyrophosphokinase [Candidatus Bathyarchaeota archaeon]